MTEAAGAVSAIVVCGGASARMGRPKTLLPFGAEPLLARVVRLVSASAAEVIVATAAEVPLPALPTDVRVVEDAAPGLGPLAGLLEGLRAVRHDLALVCGGDHPFPSTALAAHLLDAARGRDLVVPVWEDRPQPLFSVWRRSLLPRLEALVAERRLGLIAAARALGPLEVAEGEIARLDPQGLSFLDVDSPADYTRALSLLATP